MKPLHIGILVLVLLAGALAWRLWPSSSVGVEKAVPVVKTDPGRPQVKIEAPVAAPVIPAQPTSQATGTIQATETNQNFGINFQRPLDNPANVARGLNFVAGPPGAAERVLTMAKHPPNIGNFRNLSVDSNDVQLSRPPIVVYSLAVADMINGNGIEASLPLTYLYLVKSGGREILEFRVLITNAGKVGASMGQAGGTAAMSIIGQALDYVANLDEIKAGSYEPRLLEARGLFFQALWMKSLSGGVDYIYTFNGGGRMAGIESGKLYPVADFVKVAGPAAQKYIEKSGNRPGAGG